MNNKNYDVQYLSNQQIESINEVDSALSPTSSRPVQNKVIYNEFLEQETRIANNEAKINTNKLGVADNKNEISKIKNSIGVEIASLINGKIPVSQLPDELFGNVAWRGIIEGFQHSAPNVMVTDDRGDESIGDVSKLYALPTISQAKDENLDPDLYFIPTLGDYFISNYSYFEWQGLKVSQGDWLIWQGKGVGWRKVDNTDAVTSVAGFTGTITKEQLLSALNVYTREEVQSIVTEEVTEVVNDMLVEAY
jgi:hypothetical protein